MSDALHHFIAHLETHLPAARNQRDAVGIVSHALQPLLAQPHLFSPEHLEALRSGEYDGEIYHSPALDFIVRVFGWPEGCKTPVHDHETWGVMGIYQGVLHVEEYELSSAATPGYYPLALKADYHAHPGAISYLLSPEDEIHRIANPGPEYALSIHIYGRPISNYHEFDLESGQVTRV